MRSAVGGVAGARLAIYLCALLVLRQASSSQHTPPAELVRCDGAPATDRPSRGAAQSRFRTFSMHAQPSRWAGRFLYGVIQVPSSSPTCACKPPRARGGATQRQPTPPRNPPKPPVSAVMAGDVVLATGGTYMYLFICIHVLTPSKQSQLLLRS